MNLDGKTVLLVEDDVINTIVFTSIMEEWGLIVCIAVNGMEAIRMTAEKKFHLILMDINMPLMNGIQATIELRKQDQDIPIVIISGGAQDTDIVHALSAGANDYILKPVSEIRLLAIVSKWLLKWQIKC